MTIDHASLARRTDNLACHSHMTIDLASLQSRDGARRVFAGPGGNTTLEITADFFPAMFECFCCTVTWGCEIVSSATYSLNIYSSRRYIGQYTLHVKMYSETKKNTYTHHSIFSRGSHPHVDASKNMCFVAPACPCRILVVFPCDKRELVRAPRLLCQGYCQCLYFVPDHGRVRNGVSMKLFDCRVQTLVRLRSRPKQLTQLFVFRIAKEVRIILTKYRHLGTVQSSKAARPA